MTKRVRITNADGSHWGVRIKHSNGQVFDLPYPGDSTELHIAGTQDLTITEYDAAAKVPSVHAATPTAFGLFQNAASRKYLPGVWCLSTHQLMVEDHGLSPDIVNRIMANCGCDADGRYWDDNGEARPFAGRMFEQADTNPERDRLEQYNATPAVYDIVYLNGQPVLDRSESLAARAGVPLGRNPNVYAVRCRDEAAFNAWCEFMAPSRSNPGA